MKLPEELQLAIDGIATHSTHLRKAREALTLNYRAGKNSPFADEATRLAYLGARMPATYAAIYKVLENLPYSPTHLLDLGAGPGTASWAAVNAFSDLKKITLIEKHSQAIALGKKLIQSSSNPVLNQAEWICQSVEEKIPSADTAIASYVLNELVDPLALVERVWKEVSTLIVIEPGTPKGYQLINKIRTKLISLNAHLIAPCPHSLKCPIEGTDWCHFSARVERTRLHRLLKEGSLGHEDEKFSYLIATKIKNEIGSCSRILRHPQKQSGFTRLTLCTPDGTIKEETVSKKDKEIYRKARKAEWGDAW